MNACSIKGTPYEKEYEGFLKPSSIIFVWNKNNEQPLDKIKVGDEVIDNPLYQELLAHPVTNGNRIEALKIIADTFFADFTSKYHKNDSGSYNLNQVLDYIEQRQRIQDDVISQKIQSVNIPTNRAINFYNANIGGIPVEVHFTEAESQEIFETFEYLLGSTNSWAAVQKAILDQKNTLVSQIDPKNVLPSQVKQIKALTEIADNFELFKEWYLNQDTVVNVDEGAADIGEGEDWTNKGQKERSSKRILGLVTSLPTYRRAATGEFNFDENRPYRSDERVLIKGGLLGLPKSGDFQRNWNLISTALSGITDYTKQYDAIKNLAITHPQFNQLLKRLPDPRLKGSLKTIKQIMLAMGLKRIFSNPETIAVSVNINNENNIGIVTQQIKGYRHTKNLFSQLDKQYFAFNPDYAIQGENGVEFNLAKLVSDFTPLFGGSNTTVIDALSTKKNTPAESAKKIQALFTGNNKQFYINKFSDFLNALGAGLSNKDYLLPSNIDKTVEMFAENFRAYSTVFFKLNITNQVNNALAKNGKPTIIIKGPLTYIANSDNQVFPDGQNLSEDVKEVINNFVKENTASKKGITNADIFKGVLTKKETEAKRLIEYISSFDIELRPSSYLTADDKKKFTRGPWFYLTQTTKAINEAKNYEELINTPGFERFDYRRNPDVIGSLWLERLFGLPTTLAEIEANPLNSYTKRKKFGLPVDIEIRDYNGLEIKKFEGKVGQTTTDLHPGDKILQDFLGFFQSTEMENIRYGDKSSSFSIFFSNPVLGEKIYVPIVPSRLDALGGDQADLNAKKVFIETMTNYLAGEFNRVLDLIENPQAANTTYHKQGKDLFIFSDIIPEIANAVKNAQTKEDIQRLYDQAIEILPDRLDAYFSQEAKKLVKELVKTLSFPVNSRGQIATQAERMAEAVMSLNKLKFINTQLLPKGVKPKVTKENIEYLAETYLKNGFIHNVEFMKMFVGNMGNFDKLAKDAREAFKRIPFTSSPGIPPFWDSALEEFFEEDLNQDAISVAMTGVKHKFSPIVRTVVYNDVLTFTDSDFEEYKKVYDSGLWDSLTKEEKFEYKAYAANPKEADAQGLITLDFYRNYLISIEGWSDEQEAAYNDQVRIAQIGAELKTNPANAEALMEERDSLINKQGVIPFPPLKLGHYGPIVEDPKLNALHKYSLIPIVPSAVLGKQLEKQLELMYKNQVDYYTFKSGSKMADFGELIDFYKEVDSPDGKIKVVNDALSNANVTSIHLQNLRQQQYQAPKFKETSTLSTQMMKLVFGDFFEFGKLSDDFSEETQTQVSSLYDKFKQTVKDMVAFEQTKLERKLGISRDAKGNITDLNQLQLASYITKEFEKNEVPESLRKFIQVDESGNLKYPLDAIKDRSQIESALLNFINNKVINQKVHGESYIQVAGVGFERRRFAKPTAEQLAEYGANELQFYRFDPVTGKTLPMEVKIGFNPEKHGGLLKLIYKDKPIGNLQTLNEILKSNSPLAVQWREKHKDLITMAGVRIPVQGFQSMEHVIIKEFLPESSGAVMILPAQIVVKSGGDFDIDKLTFFETAYDENGKIVSNEFNLEKYKSKLEEQRDLKREKQRLVSISRMLREELESNPAYARRKDLKQEVAKLSKEVDKSIKALNELLDRPEVTPEDKAAGLDKVSEKVEIRSRAIADLKATNKSVDFISLNIIAQIREDLAEVNGKINEVENYKKGITNNLVSTLKEVLSIGQLYDYLVAPNNNNILTEYAGKGVTISTTNVFNPMTSWRIYAENILSKDALGIDAKINTMQKEFQLANLRYQSPLLNMYYLKANRDADGNISLGGKKGQDGNRISKILSEYINGHVDIAKEDWIILLGMNQETSPLAHAMILAGTPIKDVIAFIKSNPVQLVLEMGNRSKIDTKINKRFTSKYSSIKKLLLASIDPIQDVELKSAILNLQKGQKENKVKGKESVQQFIELLMENPNIQKHLTNFDPNAQLATSEEIAYRNIAYLLQFGVVIAQQESLRELTSVADFNTANYRTTFQSTELLQKKEGLKKAFNPEAIEFIFKDSALAQFNVGSFTLDVMTQIFPLTDSAEVHDRLGKMLEYADITEDEEKRKAIEAYKSNILYTYVAMFGNRPDGTSYLEYYRGKEGQFTKGVPGNMLERYQELATNPDLRTNFLFSNLYIDEDSLSPLSREIIFGIRNIETSEYAKEYREAFLEGMNHADEKVRNFFKDLALGSFMQNGAHFNQGKVSTVVPFEAYIDLTADAYNKLMDMKKNDPETFGRYLSLVGFNTSMKVNSTDSLLLALPSFLLANSRTSVDVMFVLTEELVGKMQVLENKVREAVTGVKQETTTGASTQPSTSVNKFDLADKLPPIEQNFTDGTGGRKMQPQFEGKSTMDLIISGDRTRTTRAKTDIQRMAKDYGLSKISDLVGKVIRMTDKTGRQVYTTITNVVPFTQEYQDATWQNEGWEKSVTDKHVGNYPYAIEFKVVDKPTQSSTIVNPEEYTNYSGGAIGGDTVWAEFGKEYGLGKQVDYTPATLKKLTSDQLQEVEAAYQKAVKDLGRKPLSQDTYAGGLVRRDYLQAKAADAIYAVSTLIEPGQKDAKGYINNTNKKIVSGGTGYAVQMAINLNKTVFVFNQADNTWWMYDNTRGEFGVYGATPILTKNFAGIGTREINEAGKQAIRDVYANTFKTVQGATSIKPKGVEVKEGVYVNQGALSKEEQLELFDYLKPYLETQAAKTNKGASASKMIGLGLRWDYKSNNPNRQAVNIPDVINPANKTKYGYYTESINGQALASISPRFKELMQKASGVDMTHYDGAIINLYEEGTFISSHNDVDESSSAAGYPVIGVNLGGTGNFSIESRDGDPKELNLQAGTAYIFGVNGKNRGVFHRTFPKPQDSFLPALTTQIDGKNYEAGSYRVTITMRRVMPLTEGMPKNPLGTSTQTSAAVKKINPLVVAGVKPSDMSGNAGKDIQMAEESTQFIGFQSGNATVSSTNKYREAWGNKANTGKYTANDVVMVSGSGLFRGVTEAQIKETLTNKYKPLLELAVQAGASFRVGNQYAKGNLSDELIAKYLKAKGYQEEVLPGYSRWTPKMDSDSLADEMFSNEPPVAPEPPSGPTLTPPDNKAPKIDKGIDKEGDKGNMNPLNFTEVSCQLSLGL